MNTINNTTVNTNNTNNTIVDNNTIDNSNNTPDNFIVVYFKHDNNYNMFFVRTHDKAKSLAVKYRYVGNNPDGTPEVQIQQLFNKKTHEKVVKDEDFVFDREQHYYKYEKCINSSLRPVDDDHVPNKVKELYEKATEDIIVVRYGKKYCYVTPNRNFGLNYNNLLSVWSVGNKY